MCICFKTPLHTGSYTECVAVPLNTFGTSPLFDIMVPSSSERNKQVQLCPEVFLLNKVG